MPNKLPIQNDWSNLGFHEMEVALTNTLGLGAVTDTSLEVLYTNADPIGGFQFQVSGVTISGASGGAAGDAGFTTTIGGDMVLGFSFTGGTIPAGSGVLTNLSIAPVDAEACLFGVVVSDEFGGQLDFELGNAAGDGECAIVATIAGCTDETACNYD